MACLQPLPEEFKTPRERRRFFHELKYRSSDVDLFIYGLSEEEAHKKMNHIYSAICDAIPAEAICFRSTAAVTIISQYPNRHIQIVLRLYKGPAEVLTGFDVDSCAVGFDGQRVYAMPRTHNALVTRRNVIDLDRRSPSYEMRLSKYGERGYEVLCPFQVDRSRIDPQLFERSFDNLKGLGRLLALEKLRTPEARHKFRAEQDARKLRSGRHASSFWCQLNSTLQHDGNAERLEIAGGPDVSDYATVFFPWGPSWTAKRIQKLMYKKDMILNSTWFDPNKKHHTHPCFFGTMEQVGGTHQSEWGLCLYIVFCFRVLGSDCYARVFMLCSCVHLHFLRSLAIVVDLALQIPLISTPRMIPSSEASFAS